MTSIPEVFIGMDVAKHQLDIAVRPSGERGSEANAPDAFGALSRRLQALRPTLIVLEATGGSEGALFATEESLRRPVALLIAGTDSSLRSE